MSIYVEYSVLCDRCREAEITGPGCERVAERAAKRLGWVIGVREVTCYDCAHPADNSPVSEQEKP